MRLFISSSICSGILQMMTLLVFTFETMLLMYTEPYKATPSSLGRIIAKETGTWLLKKSNMTNYSSTHYNVFTPKSRRDG